MPLSALGVNNIFLAGVRAIEQEMSFAKGVPVKIHPLFFPDMVTLLRWSRSPALATDGIILIAGSKRVVTLLKGIIDQQHVFFCESGKKLSEVIELLYTINRTQNTVNKYTKKEIIFTSREINFMWAFINGSPYQSESKRDSSIRRGVMNKIGVARLTELVIKFRLIFYLDGYYTHTQARLRNNKTLLSDNVDVRSAIIQALVK
ncbi:hypothetical protein [Citrobacter farmeri]|uniref:hypothetical protein n=1 Tax=Citrobacter farmeri TaxID=67824 RepID=UPI00292F948F|nr:hypothetical protein [Citrobacter farmeri]